MATDAEALDQIAKRYRAFGEQGIFDNMSSTIESIGDLVEETGRTVWVEEPEDV